MSDIPAGWALAHELTGHSGLVGHVAWSPDGSRLASAREDGFAIVWDVARGQAVRVIRTRGQVSAVGFSPDGGKLAVGIDEHDRTTFPTPRMEEELAVLDSPEDGPLPPEVDELLGSYDAAAEWHGAEDAPAETIPWKP